ncbi:1-aminocyclopropane-1-carboxylate synthase CMW33 [Hibiscus syriacus]|uniref:1-aminocyclopropane-1-carboxylate synthase CMW33 n=1 Tax=Hibiscus syriacus TaxID=106335 RepID=A0A6A3AAG3_HIBSY|nr:1-aminocyclopropane-1-carboxylate synthase CMW33 [Hibiscus syriacus]
MEFKSKNLLSKMATNDGHGENSPYFDGWKAYDSNPFHPTQNPHGVIQMGLAENKLCPDLIKEWILENPDASICTARGIDKFNDIAIFQDYHGLKEFREAVAKFMGRVGGNKVTFDANRIMMGGGATGANEMVMFCLADPGDTFLVPSPFYAGRPHSQPFEPFSTVDPDTMRNIVSFVNEKTIHLVCNEIYAATVFSSPRFISIAEIIQDMDDCNPDLIHIVYSLSKDMGIPGFRVIFALLDAFGRRVRGEFPKGKLQEVGQKAPCFRQGAGTSWDFLLEKQHCENQRFSGFIFPLLRAGLVSGLLREHGRRDSDVALHRIQAFVLGQENQELDKSKHWRKKHLRLSFSSSRLYDEMTIMSPHIISPHSPLVQATT